MHRPGMEIGVSQPLRVLSDRSMTSPLVNSYGELVHSAQTSWPKATRRWSR